MFKRFRDDMKKYWKYAVYSSKAQLKSEIANSYLNWLWWILDPLCFMLMYSCSDTYSNLNNSILRFLSLSVLLSGTFSTNLLFRVLS